MKNEKKAETNNTLLDVFSSILAPGVHPMIFKMMNIILITLFFCILIIILGGYGNIHVYIFLILGLCLFTTIQWFRSEYEHYKNQEAIKNKKN